MVVNLVHAFKNIAIKIKYMIVVTGAAGFIGVI